MPPLTNLHHTPSTVTALPIAYTIPDAQQASGIGRTKLYELIARRDIEARKVGSRTLIMADSLRSYISSLPPAKITPPKERAPVAA